MIPAHHAVSGALTSIPVFYYTGSATLTAYYFAAHMLMDVDHLFDYLLWGERPLSVRTLLAKHSASKWPKLSFVFHSYELFFLLLLASLFSGNEAIWVLAAGGLTHLFFDETANRFPSNPSRISPFFYFFTFRLSKGFDRKKLLQ